MAVAATPSKRKSGPENKSAIELREFVIQDCGSCHGTTLKGGLGPSMRPAEMRGLTLFYLEAIISNGIVGTAMPPWKEILSKDDIRKISKGLQTGKYIRD